MISSWLEEGMCLLPARHLHITCLGHNDRDSIDVRGLEELLQDQVGLLLFFFVCFCFSLSLSLSLSVCVCVCVCVCVRH